MDNSHDNSNRPRMGIALSALIDSGVFAGVLIAAVFALSFMRGRLGFEHLSYQTMTGTFISVLIVVAASWPLGLLVWGLNKKGVFSSPVTLVFSVALMNVPAVILAYLSMDGWGKGLAIRIISAVVSVIIISKLNDRESP